jgi:hypothetical protein
MHRQTTGHPLGHLSLVREPSEDRQVMPTGEGVFRSVQASATDTVEYQARAGCAENV